jgi:hypothetical protein
MERGNETFRSEERVQPLDETQESENLVQLKGKELARSTSPSPSSRSCLLSPAMS